MKPVVPSLRMALLPAALSLALAGASGGEPATNVPSGSAPAAATNAVPTNQLWFPVGETMTYKVYWGFIPVGEAQVTTSWVESNGVRHLRIDHRVRSNKVIATLYPVNDTIQTIIDPETFRSVSFFMDRNEGRHSAREITTFDYEKGVARWESFTKKKVKTIPIDKDTRDLVTFMYFMRKDGFRVGAERNFRVMADDKVYDLNLKVAAEEKMDVDGYGKVDCLRLDPTAQFNGLFVRKGKMTVWVSRDRRSLCTRVSAGVPVIGSVNIYLTSVGGPGDDMWVKKDAKPNTSGEAPETGRARP